MPGESADGKPPVVYRAPMRARSLDRGQFEGAAHGVAASVVGIGDRLDRPPGSLSAAILAATAEHGEKAGRMLARFAGLPDGSLVWAQTGETEFRLGALDGPWRYDDSPAARRTGIHHVRPAQWLPARFGPEAVPGAVLDAFARGGRNLQRIGDPEAERRSRRLWAEAGPEGGDAAGGAAGA